MAYLDALLDRAEPEELAAAFGRIARAAGGARLAEKVELSADALYRALCRRANPDLRSATLLLKAMGMRLVLQPIERTMRGSGPAWNLRPTPCTTRRGE